MKKKRLGKTNFSVSELGFGGIPIMSGRESGFLVDLKNTAYEEAIRTLKLAVEKDINFFDTAIDYGDSEEKMGIAFKTNRKDVYIASKSKALKYDKMLEDVKKSLVALQTDYIDLYQLHFVKDKLSYETIMDEENGAFKALVQCKNEGLIREIGIASHNPFVLGPAIESGNFATVQLPVNLLEQECVELIEKANLQDMGIIAMKPYAGGTLVKPLPDLLDLGLTGEIMKKLALSYCISAGVTTVIPGVSNQNELLENVEIYHKLNKITQDELEKRNIIIDRIGKVFCRRCQYCEPCPAKIEISKILRFYKYYKDYNLKEWAIKQYSELNTKGSACVKCHKCEGKCPYDIKIVEELEKIHKFLGGTDCE